MGTGGSQVTGVGRGDGAGAFQRRKRGVGIVLSVQGWVVGEDGKSRGEEGGSGEGDGDLGSTRGWAADGNAPGILYGSSSDPPLPLPSLGQNSAEGEWGEVGHVMGKSTYVPYQQTENFPVLCPN